MPGQSKKPLKLPYALRNDQIVHISEVTSGKHTDCICPECRRSLVARKGLIKRQHFAHDPGATCNIESALHYVAKRMICDGVNRAIAEHRSIGVTWKCHYCGEQHAGDLVRKAASAKLEQDLEQVRPDVLLVDIGDKPIAAIEVVVTHAPEPEAMQFYLAKRLGLLIVELNSESQLDALRDLRSLSAQFGTVCLRRKCPKCAHPLMPSPVCVVTSDCYRCRQPMQIAFRFEKGGFDGPEAFSDEDIARARKEGCILQTRFSHTVQRAYLASVCGACHAFLGQHYLIDHAYTADTPERNAQQVYCPECNAHFD